MAISPPARLDDDGIAREQRLVARARSDPEAFAELYDLYVERIYRYAYRRLGAHSEAEDLTSQTFHRALEGLPRYEVRGLPFGAWLFRIAHNLIADRRRAPAGAVSLDGILDSGGPLPAPTDGPDEVLVLREQGDAAWAAVAILPALQRRAVVLRFARGLSHAEVGVLIGRSEPATKQLVYRAIQTLRLRLALPGEGLGER